MFVRTRYKYSDKWFGTASKHRIDEDKVRDADGRMGFFRRPQMLSPYRWENSILGVRKTGKSLNHIRGETGSTEECLTRKINIAC